MFNMGIFFSNFCFTVTAETELFFYQKNFQIPFYFRVHFIKVRLPICIGFCLPGRKEIRFNGTFADMSHFPINSLRRIKVSAFLSSGSLNPLSRKLAILSFAFIVSLSTNKLILIAPCAILSSRKNNGGKHGNDKAENMGNNG